MGFLDRVRDVAVRLEGRLREGGLPPRYPTVAVELAPDRITAVRVAADRKSREVRVQEVASCDLPAGAIEPSLVRPNVLQPEPVRSAISAVLSRMVSRDHRVSVLVPDHVARVALLGFASLPRTRRELADLVWFRMAKSLPFKQEEAAMDLVVLDRNPAGGSQAAEISLLAVFIHRAVLEQYEGLLTGLGYWPGLVGLSTFELYNLFRPRIAGQGGGDRDALLLNVTPHYLSLLIFSGAALIFYRCKPHPRGATEAESLASLGREIYTSLAFYQEKLLGRGLERVFLRVGGMPRDAVLKVVQTEAGCPVEPLDLLQVLGVAGNVSLGAEEAERIAPAAGAVAGRRS